MINKLLGDDLMEHIIKLFEEIKESNLEDKPQELENRLTEIANNKSFAINDSLLEKIILENNDHHIGYCAFYTLSIIYRVNKEGSKLDRLFQLYGKQFENEKTYLHTYLIAKSTKLNATSAQNGSLTEMLNSCVKNVEQLSANGAGHSGSQNLLAEMFVHIYHITTSAQKPQLKEKWYPVALEAVEKAISYNPSYAKYYNTKAKILTINNQFDDASLYVSEAIDKEDSNAKNYAVKLMNYQFNMINIESERSKYELDGKFVELDNNLKNTKKQMITMQDKLDEELKNSSVKSIEVIGFFAGIISFFISSIQISSTRSVYEAAALITLLMGTCIISYAAFSFIIHQLKKEYIIKSLIMCAMGGIILLIGGGILCFGN